MKDIEKLMSGECNWTDLELSQLLHVLSSLQKTSSGDLYYYAHFLGLDVRDRDRVTMKLGIHNANTYGVAQGGAIYTLADIAIGYKLLSILGETNKVLTMELKINYIQKGTGPYLYAMPIISHIGRKTAIAQANVFNEEDELVALALGTFAINR